MRRRIESPGVLSLSLILLMTLILPGLTEARGLDRARRLALQGQYGPARAAARRVLRRSPNDPEALQIVVATSCELGDADSARRAHRRLAPDVQSMVERHCARRGIQLVVARPVRVSVPPGAADFPPATAPDPRRPWRVAFWSTAAGSVAMMVASVGLALEVQDISDQKIGAIAVQRMRTGQAAWGSSNDVCAEAQADGVAELTEICQRGKRMAVASNVLLGVGLAGTAISGYLYYRAYINGERPAPRVAVSPAVSPTSGGLSLRLTF